MKEKVKDINFDELMYISDTLWGESMANLQKQMYKRKRHCIKVARISMELFEYFLKKRSISIDKQLISTKKEEYAKRVLYFSSLVHDIRRFEKKHNVKSANYVYSELENDIKKKDLENIKILIKAHNSEGDISFIEDTKKISQDEMKFLIIIIRLADKISKVNEDEGKDIITQIDKAIEESIGFIYDIWKESQFEIIKKYIIENYR